MSHEIHIPCNCIDKYSENMSKLFRETIQLPFIISEDGTTKQAVMITENGKHIISRSCPFCGLKYQKTNGEIKEEEKMTVEQKIDQMILTLQVAKDEIEYAKKYKDSSSDRSPSGTIIRENLKSVARLAGVLAYEVILSPYSRGKIFKSEEDENNG